MTRKSLAKKVRIDVYNKYEGHCAYCGKKIEYKDMQVDHLIPVQRARFGKYTEEQLESFENYMPADRRCNHYKRAHSLEVFRRYIKEIPEKLKETNYIYKVGLDYGIIEEHSWDGLFYFEWFEKNCKE